MTAESSARNSASTSTPRPAKVSLGQMPAIILHTLEEISAEPSPQTKQNLSVQIAEQTRLLVGHDGRAVDRPEPDLHVVVAPLLLCQTPERVQLTRGVPWPAHGSQDAVGHVVLSFPQLQHVYQNAQTAQPSAFS